MRVFTGTQSGNNQSLGFTARKQGRTVSCRQNINLALNRANGFSVTTVNTTTGCQNFFTNDFMHQFFNNITDITHFNFVFGINCCFNFFRNLTNQSTTSQFIGFFKSFGVFCFEIFFNTSIQSIKLRRKRRMFPSFFAGFFSELVNHINNRLELIETEHNGTEHGFFRQLVGF